MRCSEALFATRPSTVLFACIISLAVSRTAVRAEDPPAAAIEHETKKPQPTNRLANETSPYLLLHAHNPVDWRPWGPDALQAAKDANQPIFLSVGYSSCYWCHVMEREVFENATIAEYLNEHFVCIKVDREERPDIDDQYMLALQLYFQATGSTQGGGWPMSMFLTPDAKPFAGGTYFPAEDKPGQPGFRTVLDQIHTLWTTRETDLRNNADFLATAVKRNSQPGLALEKVELDESLVQGAVNALLETHDPDHGGFFDPQAPGGPKFPSVPSLMLLLLTEQPTAVDSAEKSNDKVQQALDLTLTRMAMGGIRDHLGGGFHRYSVNRDWQVPHFEKMLYDQAQLAEVYWYQYDLTENPLYRQVAEETLDFVLQEMTSPEGGFYSALDAETDGVEGQYYVWSREEVYSLLGQADADLFAAAYGLNHATQFEHGHVLYLPQSLAKTANGLRMPVSDLETQLAAVREKLLAARRQRPALLKDEKILTSWNGLMIRALALAGFDEDGANPKRAKYRAAAEQAAKFILDNMRDNEGRLLHSYAGGKAGIRANLDDYAYFISGLQMLAFAADQGVDWMQISRSLTDQQFVLFWDERSNGFFSTADDHEPLLARMKDANDSALPSANGVSAQNLAFISNSMGTQSYREPLEQALAVFAPALQDRPASLPTMACALVAFLENAGGETVEATTVPTQASPAAETQLALAPQDELVPAAQATDEDAKKHDKLTATAYLSVDKLPAGGECNVAIVLNVKEGWHINANPAQPKFLIPTELTAALPAELTLTDIRYPAGAEFAQQGSDEPLMVYEGRVVLYGKLKAPAAAAGQAGAAEITVRYQACNDQMCLPPKKLLLKGTVAVAKPGEKSTPINQSLFKPKRPQPPM